MGARDSQAPPPLWSVPMPESATLQQVRSDLAKVYVTMATWEVLGDTPITTTQAAATLRKVLKP